MLKKLSIAGLALIASTGIAFADTNDSMSPADASTVSDNSAAAPSDASSDAASTTSKPVAHKKHKRHHKKHHHRHHYTQAAPAASDEPVASAAPMGDYKGSYKGEVAAPCPTCPPPVTGGAYVGLAAGSVLDYTNRRSIYNGLQGTLFGGYGWMWDQYYAGLEIFVQDSAEMTNYVNNNAGSIKTTWGYGASVLPGYMIQENVLGFLRLGVIDTRFSSRNSNQFGGQVGLGLQTALCNNWDLRGEYDYSFYNSKKPMGVPRSQQFNLGLIYKFAL